VVKELVRVVAMERPVYADPVTSFLDDLYTFADFEKAQVHINFLKWPMLNF